MEIKSISEAKKLIIEANEYIKNNTIIEKDITPGGYF